MIHKVDNCQKSLYVARKAFIALACVLFLITSCSNLFEPLTTNSPESGNSNTPNISNASEIVINCTGTYDSSLPGVSSWSRNAKPSLPNSQNITFSVTAETVERASDGTSPAKTSTGTVNASTSTFNIPLVTGYKWKITVTEYKIVQVNGESQQQAILSDTYTMSSVLSPDNLNISHTFILQPLGSGTGDIDLSMSVNSGINVSSVVMSGLSSSSENLTLSEGACHISKTGVSSGAHYVTIDFKKDSELVFSTTQTIIVYPNLTTNTWVSGGGSLDPINSSGQFQVTAALVDLFKRSQFFVGNPNNGNAGDDTNGDGSPVNPFATVGKALQKIAQSGSGSVDYTIRISGTIRENITIPSSGDNAITTSKARSITLLGQRGLNGSGVPNDELNGDANNDGTGDGTVLTVNSAVPVTIKNLRITKGNATNGGGIYSLTTGATISLENGALITGNTAEMHGGGVYVFGANSSLVMNDGSKISENHVTGSNADYGGLGVYIGCDSTTTESNYPTFTLNGGEISRHSCGSTGAPAGSIKGMGIMLGYAKLVMNGGKITENGAVSNNGDNTLGGNIYADHSKIEINSGEISKGSIKITNYYASAGGIWLAGSSTLTMTGGKIIENYVSPGGVHGGNGGAIVLWDSSSIEITGGEISGNYIDTNNSGVQSQGGAIHVAANGGTVKIGGSAYIPYSVNGETGLGSNDVFLSSGKTVTITSSLTGTNPVATLTPDDYDREDALVVAESGGTVTLANETGKFAVTPNGSNDYVLDSQGKLKPGTMVSPSSVENLTLVAGESYNLVLSSDFTADNLATLLTSIKNSSISGASVDLSNASITQLGENSNTWIPEKITSITLPPGLQTIAPQEFQNAVDLAEIRMPNDGNSSYSVEDGILYNSTKTALLRYPPAKAGEEFTLPDTVTMLGYQAFYHNKNLVKINGLNQIETFTSNGHSVFSSTQKLEEADLTGLTCTELPYRAFESSKVKKIFLSSSITVLGDWSITSCSNLTEIHFKTSSPPDLATNDNRKNFTNCNSNLKFYVPKGSKSAYLNATGDKGFANSSYNAYATSPDALAARVFEEDPEVLNMLYVKGSSFSGSSAITGSEVFIADRELIIPDLYVSDHEVTQAEYQAVMGENPSWYKNSTDGEDPNARPVEAINWYAAIAYCNKRSAMENLDCVYTINNITNWSNFDYSSIPTSDDATWNAVTADFTKNGYRLPTDAEWEYLARGGNLTNSGQTTYSGTNSESDLSDYAWYNAINSTSWTTHPVKTKKSNSLALYDMSGNVIEWCWDLHSDNITSGTASVGPSSGSNRVARSGSAGHDAASNTVANRAGLAPHSTFYSVGFRVVRSLSYSFHDSVTMLPAGTPGTAGTEDTSYASFGDWPQTLKESSVDVDENQTLTRGGFTYFKGSDGNWYAKQQEKAYATGYVYADETTPVAQSSAGSYKYFKVEPIKWRVLTTEFDHDGLSTTDGKKLLLAENILIFYKYNDGNNNAYDVSLLRSYLSGGFYNTAFTSALKTMILTTTSANDAESACIAGSDYVCDPTEDKVFALSQAEATSYGFNSDGSTDDSTRVRKPTDFAMASGVYTDQFTDDNKGGKWWLRSPAQYNTTKQLVTSTGSMTVDHGWESGVAAGIVPALCLNN